MPIAVPRLSMSKTPPIAAAMVARNCELRDYAKVPVPPVKVKQQVIAYCSPDSTYAVTKRLIDAAKKSILIGIYDFSAAHMVELIEAALQRGVKVKLMLDIDNDRERQLFEELGDLGVEGVPAPSCASKRARFFASSHEKVIVIDGEWSLVQSGNYSSNSIPLNVKDGGDPANFRTGNRDTGLAICSKPLAKFFTKILESDMALELAGPSALAMAKEAAEAEAAFLVEMAPRKIPDKLFPSKSFKFKTPLRIEPVLSPDNYMDLVPGKLRAARKSVLIQQQYVRSSQTNIVVLLDAIKAAREEAGDLDIRIILGKIFDRSDLPKERENLKRLEDEYGLKLGPNIRYIDTSRLVHCHNKMVLVDGKGVLVSSQNWSHSAVTKNREAGLWLSHKSICTYFTGIFETDWKTARQTLEAPPAAMMMPKEAMKAGGFVRVERADYEEV
ncbi:MAG: phospholipase D-like domain-containing protein [Aestuariivirga sp.]